jgi:hypothetical protein
MTTEFAIGNTIAVGSRSLIKECKIRDFCASVSGFEIGGGVFIKIQLLVKKKDVPAQLILKEEVKGEAVLQEIDFLF